MQAHNNAHTGNRTPVTSMEGLYDATTLCVRLPSIYPHAQTIHIVVRLKHTTAASYYQNAETRDRAGDLQIFGLTLSQLSYRGLANGAIGWRYQVHRASTS